MFIFNYQLHPCPYRGFLHTSIFSSSTIHSARPTTLLYSTSLSRPHVHISLGVVNSSTSNLHSLSTHTVSILSGKSAIAAGTATRDHYCYNSKGGHARENVNRRSGV